MHCLLAAGALAAAGCSGKPLLVGKPAAPKTMQEGVTVSAAIVYDRPWSEVVDSLSPKFDNTAAGALSSVLQTQSYSDFRLLSAVGIQGKASVNLVPNVTNSDESTRNIGQTGSGDTLQTTKDETSRTITTKTVDSNAAPALPGDVTGVADGRSASGLPDLIGASRSPTSEPAFQHAVAAALFQEIALLNDAVAGIPEYAGLKPYIIRFRVGVTAFRRDLPWDIYAHISMFDGNQTTAEDGVVLLPILSTESYEGTLDASALEQLFDLRLALQASASKASVGGAFNRLNDNLTTFLTRRYDASVRISGSGGNAINAKFGASRDKTGFAFVDRDHYVTAIAYLKPPEPGQPFKPYRVFLSYEARDVKSGRLIKQNTDAFYAALAPVVARMAIPDSAIKPSCGTRFDDLLYTLSEDIALIGNAAAIVNMKACFTDETIIARIQSGANYLSSSVVAVRDLLPPTSFPFYIRPKAAPTAIAFANMIGPQVQSSKKALVVAVPYEGELRVENARAILVPDGVTASSFAPSAVSLKVSGVSSQLVATFPPIATLSFDGLSSADAAKLKTPAGWRICAAASSADITTCSLSGTAPPSDAYYAHSLGVGYAPAPTADSPEFKMDAPAQAVTIGADGTASFAVYVEPAKGATVTIEATGGELLVGGSPANEIKITAKGMQSVSLRNTTPGGVVVLTGTSTAPADENVKVVKAVTIGIRAPAAVAKQ